MDTTDKLIELGTANPEYANMIQELMQFKQLSQNGSCKGLLNILIDGLLCEADCFKVEQDPFMEPIGVKSPTRINTVDVNGEPTSVWFTNSFNHRLEFLLKGRIAITYPNKASIVPLIVRLDVSKIVTIGEV